MSSIRTLRTFLAVARLGSFAAAGDEVGLTAAAVGLRMRALERDLNQALFDRGARAVVLNTAGRQVVPQVERLIAEYEALAVGADGDGEALAGTVVMGALVSALMGAFADALWAIRQEHPRLEVKLFAGQSGTFAEKVLRGELDAAVVMQSPRPLPSSVAWTRLYGEPMVLIVPRRPHFWVPEDPIAILRSSPFIRFDRETWTGLLVKRVLRRTGVTVAEGMELNSVEAIVAIVRQGFGVSIVPRLANVDWRRDRDLKVIEIPGVQEVRHVGLLERVHHSRRRFTAAIKGYFGVDGTGRSNPH
ncbi:MAG: LysR family transcriptional regulator [Burkholderiaceae bacterium]|nr:LysR family transcriptional regulator [Burkholderiaceae bacterium]